jgi:hypothetical protein
MGMWQAAIFITGELTSGPTSRGSNLLQLGAAKLRKLAEVLITSDAKHWSFYRMADEGHFICFG